MIDIQMVDLKGQYARIKEEIDTAIQGVLNSTQFINGPEVKAFQEDLKQYLGVKRVIACANGTDALQIALMSLGLQPGDEVIVPCFTYVATAEVIALLKLKPVLVDVDPNTFNITSVSIEKAITSKTKAIVPVHLFGQCADMEPIMELATKYDLFVIEDAAQAIGADYTFSDGTTKKAGTIGDIGCTSFFPSKNLGCFGDGGAIFTDNIELSAVIQKIANHGQAKKYYHEVVGVNSRLDTLQAAILGVKLKYLDSYSKARSEVAEYYDSNLGDIDWLQIPARQVNSSHVFHQYTLNLAGTVQRESLRRHLENSGIPSMIYYPVPLHLQNAFKTPLYTEGAFPVSEALCASVISLPIHTEMTKEVLYRIVSAFKSFEG